jgi:hypothetical protein
VNSIGEIGAEHLAKALAQNKSITYLALCIIYTKCIFLGCNSFGEKGQELIKKAANKNPKIEF